LLAAPSLRAKYSQNLAQRNSRTWRNEKNERQTVKHYMKTGEQMQTTEDRYLISYISSLVSNSTEMYKKCDKSGNVVFVKKANALRRTAEEKQKEVDTLDKEMAKHLLATKP